MSLKFHKVKSFGELEPGDYIYFIKPLEGSIDHIIVHSISEFNAKYTHVKYYTSNSSLTMGAHIKESLPTKSIYCPSKVTMMITNTNPPSVYCTSKTQLQTWMKK